MKHSLTPEDSVAVVEISAEPIEESCEVEAPKLPESEENCPEC
jgi:hypothetical protein